MGRSAIGHVGARVFRSLVGELRGLGESTGGALEMEYAEYAGLTVVAAMLAVCITGAWRVLLWPFRIRTARMTVARLGLTVAPADVARVEGILHSFAGGFNAMLTRPTWSSWQRYCDSLSTLYGPFAHEGAAMGYTPRRLFRYAPADFEAAIVKPRPHMRYLYYVGLGFWSGMRHHDPRRLARIVDGLDPLHRYLCYDGYGFRYAFFEYLRDPGVVRRLDALEGYARHAAYQGLGRAFWFLFMGDPDRLIDRLASVPGRICP